MEPQPHSRAVQQAKRLVVSDTPEGLAAIHQLDCAAALWQRDPLPSFQSWINELAADQLPQTQLMLHSDSVHQVTTQVCDMCGTPKCDERELLIDDIAASAHIFAVLMSTEFISLRLKVVAVDACCKFHLDSVTARLICTYRGPGTQYGLSYHGAAPNQLFTAPTGAPLMIRGTKWPVRSEPNLLHRSPPIERSGKTRLVLTIDPVNEQPGVASYVFH